METRSWLKSALWRNVIGATALLIAYLIPNRLSWSQRNGFDRFSPYLFLLLMYGWIVFHNRVLFEGMYLSNKKRAYVIWTTLHMTFSSIIMHVVLVYGFDQTDTISKILTFWVFTITGLGIYVIFRFLHIIEGKKPVRRNVTDANATSTTYFSCIVDGSEKQIPHSDILYFESLENYVKVITSKKTHIVRQSLKDAELKLPKSLFLRISRSNIINTDFMISLDQDSITINGQSLKIGKVFKRYVEEQLSMNAKS
jgi:hypothetical protein